MPNQENGTLKMAGNFMALLLTLAPPPAHGSVVCWEEGDQFLVAPLGQQERVELACNVLDCVGDTWSSGFFLTLLGAQMGMLA